MSLMHDLKEYDLVHYLLYVSQTQLFWGHLGRPGAWGSGCQKTNVAFEGF